MPRVVHFEIHAESTDRAIKFYTALFGWSFQKWEGPMPYWIVTTGEKSSPGIDGGLILRRGPGPVSGQAVSAFICTIEVPNLDEFVAKAGTLGGAICVPKMPIPGVGWLAYATDTEGNIFGMMHNDPNAK
jgi:predicted enzyme related to lactoylglutathione lyase